jgi:hypothetical protein
MRCAHGSRSVTSTLCATGPRPTMARSPGRDHAASARASRPRGRSSI